MGRGGGEATAEGSRDGPPKEVRAGLSVTCEARWRVECPEKAAGETGGGWMSADQGAHVMSALRRPRGVRVATGWRPSTSCGSSSSAVVSRDVVQTAFPVQSRMRAEADNARYASLAGPPSRRTRRRFGALRGVGRCLSGFPGAVLDLAEESAESVEASRQLSLAVAAAPPLTLASPPLATPTSRAPTSSLDTSLIPPEHALIERFRSLPVGVCECRRVRVNN